MFVVLGHVCDFGKRNAILYYAEINAGTSSRSMISFWSVSGTERYVPKSQKTTSDCGGSSDELRRMQVEIDALRGEVSRWEIQHIEAESRLAQLRAELKAHEA